MKKQTIIPLAVLSLVAVGGVLSFRQITPKYAYAQTQSSKVQQVAEKPDSEAIDGNVEAKYTSSVQTKGNDSQENESVEATKLSPLAKISPEQAKAIAEKSTGAKATSVMLENENGNVVYAVTVGKKEVKVDAGNGHILASESAEAGEGAEREAN